MTTSVITASTVGNVEKLRRNRPRHRGTTMESESRMIFTRRDKRMQHQLNTTRLGAHIGFKLLSEFGGCFDFDDLADFVSAMDEKGVINRRIVRDPMVRTATIANVVYEMIEDGRLVGGRELQSGGRRVGFVMLSPEEYSIRAVQLKRREDRRNEKKTKRNAAAAAARANGQPTPMSRRERRRQKARREDRRNQARALAAQKKGRSSAKMPSTRAA